MLTVTTAPAAEPISLDEARAICRIDADIDEHDALLTLFIQVARERAEHETGRALITRALRLTVPATCRLVLRPAPLVAVSTVTLIDCDNTETEVAAADRRVDTSGPLPVLVLENGTEGARDLQVDFTAGYGAAGSAVPAAIRNWMLMQISTLFEHRETVVVGASVTALPTPFVDGLLDPFRLHPGF